MRSRSPVEAAASAGTAPAPGRPSQPPTPGRSSASPAGGVAALAPGLLGAVAEGAWIAVVAAAVAAPIGGPGPAGELLPSVLAALLGFAAARLLPIGGGRAVALLAVAVAVVMAGFIAGPALGLAMADGPRPVGLYVVLGFAVLRGAAQGDPSAGSHVIDALVRRSPFLLGGAWTVGLIMAGQARAEFMAAAAFDSLVFVVTAALALGTSRLAALPPEVRRQLGGNAAWLVMVGAVVGLALLIALPLAAILGQPIGAVASTIAAGATTAILGFAGALVTVLLVVVDAIASVLRGLLNLSQIQPPTQPPPETTPQEPLPAGAGGSSSTILEPLIALAIVVGLVLLAWYLARRWQGARRVALPQDVPEARGIDLGARPGLLALRVPKRLRALFGPDDATGAYERLLTDWAAAPDLARDPAETPGAHAARLRTAGTGDMALDLLAASYQLARFAGVRLTPAEERRAIGRWRRLRGRAKGRGGPRRAEDG